MQNIHEIINRNLYFTAFVFLPHYDHIVAMYEFVISNITQY